MNAQEYIQSLDLQPHPEGGYFKEVYRAQGKIEHQALPAQFNGPRNYATSIYFLLISGQKSSFHKINQDEGWHFYAGSPLTLHMLSPDGLYSQVELGQNLALEQNLQYFVPAGFYFAATVNQSDSFSLVGCTVAPGFDFADFVMPHADELAKEFPQHQEIIEQLGHR
ncbi:hypothetical protein C2869_01295 [Saccharobesus litoralis]|uniref:DUF985 domain-containing protein n=1 Tax=Saccharobesus litoralis TaxID=2172099 RepID=A0A2S0VM20_9ALTE|nr:cupin domain-containing protein [Saccharobesus litoralis]AWB65160.1 hypothetical protein C2869_01295 [Saccharobesus litoralis]